MIYLQSICKPDSTLENIKMFFKQLITWDANWSAAMRIQSDQKILWRVSVLLAHSGDSWYWLAGLFPVWLIGIFFSPHWHRISGILAFSLVIEAAFILAVKFLVRRRRPEGEWGEIYRSTDPHSFPSGHAARMALIAIMSWGIAPVWFAILVTVWTPLVCVARVMMGVHYWSDVVVGVLMGLLSGWLLLQGVPFFVPFINSFLPFAF